MSYDPADLLSVFQETYEAHFDEPYRGDTDAVIEALELADEDWDSLVLSDAFEEAGVEDAENWPPRFWSDLSTALLEL